MSENSNLRVFLLLFAFHGDSTGLGGGGSSGSGCGCGLGEAGCSLEGPGGSLWSPSQGLHGRLFIFTFFSLFRFSFKCVLGTESTGRYDHVMRYCPRMSEIWRMNQPDVTKSESDGKETSDQMQIKQLTKKSIKKLMIRSMDNRKMQGKGRKIRLKMRKKKKSMIRLSDFFWSKNILISSVEYFGRFPSTVWNFENFGQNHNTPHIASTTIFSNDFNQLVLKYFTGRPIPSWKTLRTMMVASMFWPKNIRKIWTNMSSRWQTSNANIPMIIF